MKAVALGLALFGTFSAPLTIWAQTLRMCIIPAELRGRTFALLRMLMQSGNPIGGAVAGGLLPLLGMAGTVALSALLVRGPGIVGYSSKVLRFADTAYTPSEPTPALEGLAAASGEQG